MIDFRFNEICFIENKKIILIGGWENDIVIKEIIIK